MLNPFKYSNLSTVYSVTARTTLPLYTLAQIIFNPLNRTMRLVENKLACLIRYKFDNILYGLCMKKDNINTVA